MNCNCEKNAILLVVTKNNENKGRKFYTCEDKKCNFFKWYNNYNPSKFKEGFCNRCGRFGCSLEDCYEETDFFGNIIP